MVALWSGLNTGQRDETIIENAKADMLALTLREATRLSIEAARPAMVDSLDRLDMKATTGAQDVPA
jgi:hypothetical protein